MYEKSRTFLFFVLVALLLKAVISTGNAYSNQLDENRQRQTIAETVAAPETVYSDLKAESPPGKSYEQILAEIEGLATTYLFLDVAVESGADQYAPQRERVKKALEVYLKNTLPVLLEGGIEQNMRRDYFPDILDTYLENLIAIDPMFARSMLIMYTIENVNMNRVLTEFRMPSQDQIDEAESIIAANGFNKEGFINAMIAYRSRFLNL